MATEGPNKQRQLQTAGPCNQADRGPACERGQAQKIRDKKTGLFGIITFLSISCISFCTLSGYLQ